MASFVSIQDEGVVAPAATGIASAQALEKQLVPWPTVVAMFKTSSEQSPMSAPPIAANTTLEQDKATVLRCWLAMGGTDDTLRRVYYDEYEYTIRDEPSDDASEWKGVEVEGGRVMELYWNGYGLAGAMA